MAFVRIIAGKLLADVLNRTDTNERIETLAQEIAEKKTNPYSAVEEILR